MTAAVDRRASSSLGRDAPASSSLGRDAPAPL